MEPIFIIYQSDDNYAPFMGVSIYSLFKNNIDVDDIVVFIIDDDISDNNKQKLLSLANEYKRTINFLSISPISDLAEAQEFAQYNGMRKNKHSYYKLFMAHILPKEIHRILYIDCDTLVVGTIQDLVNIEMGDNIVGMVLDSLVYKGKTSIGLNLSDCYYNSGVILINLDLWREKKCENMIVDTLKKHGQYGTVDQDVLNVALYNKICTLPMDYNVQPHHLDFSIKTYFRVFPQREDYYSVGEISKALSSPKIIHFFRYLGKSPWNTNNYHPDEKMFDSYLSCSPWKDYVKLDRALPLSNKIEVILYRILPKTVYFKLFIFFHERMIVASNVKK